MKKNVVHVCSLLDLQAEAYTDENNLNIVKESCQRLFLNAKQCDKNNNSFNTYVGWLDYTMGPKIYLDSESLALGGISLSHTRNDDSILNASKVNEHPRPIF